MPLVPCRACDRQVDTSALACPQCGATDPGKELSRQQRNFRVFLIQLVVWLTLAGMAGWYVWNELVPTIRQYVVKPAPEAPAPARP